MKISVPVYLMCVLMGVIPGLSAGWFIGDHRVKSAEAEVVAAARSEATIQNLRDGDFILTLLSESTNPVPMGADLVADELAEVQNELSKAQAQAKKRRETGRKVLKDIMTRRESISLSAPTTEIPQETIQQIVNDLVTDHTSSPLTFSSSPTPKPAWPELRVNKAALESDHLELEKRRLQTPSNDNLDSILKEAINRLRQQSR